MGKVLHFWRLRSANPSRSGYFYIVEGLMDLWWIGRLTEIGCDCRAHFEPPMQCQYPNPGPIQCQSRTRFGLAISRQSEKIEVNPLQCKRQFVANRGSDRQIVCCQSNANRSPMSCQFDVNPRPPATSPPFPIQCQSIANSVPILCQSNANMMPMQIFNPKPIRCQSVANLMPIESQFIANPMSIESPGTVSIDCQSTSNP